MPILKKAFVVPGSRLNSANTSLNSMYRFYCRSADLGQTLKEY
ncbi:hypothetical protein G436_3047 [Leptospira interrogans serovar Hardjo str. Norma]|uniref:Uncharacterized protein n=1 Tax=Leptospira interrogans serovar Hardjo str. Norma TaxID=1279460 RepID=A0A0M4NLA6_LEPIR|nr:hypothetical protein G436_3047 [Leptospira interrogans serovar Hardjo str. Norma]